MISLVKRRSMPLSLFMYVVMIRLPWFVVLCVLILFVCQRLVFKSRVSLKDDFRDLTVGAFNRLSRGVTKNFPNRVDRHERGVDIIWTGAKNIFMNNATRMQRARTLAELEDSLRYVQSQFNALGNGVGGIFIFEVSSLLANGYSKDIIKEISSKYRFKVEFNTTMARVGGLYEEVNIGGLEIKRVKTMKQLTEILNFFFPGDTTDWSLMLDFYKSIYSYVGYVDGKVATTASTCFYKDTVFLHSVGTHPEFRNHGYATAISKYALQNALDASGIKLSLLHASEMGEPVYKNIGFEHIGIAAYAVYQHTEDV
jgi:GNAT superfamily N-acetyltransferase